MFPEQWISPCNNQCTKKFAALNQIPWRVFCKKGCATDAETWEECLGACNEICYKDPVFKDKQWSACIDRSPGADISSEQCFNACASGCGSKFGIDPDEVKRARPNRPPKPPPVIKSPRTVTPASPSNDIPSSSA